MHICHQQAQSSGQSTGLPRLLQTCVVPTLPALLCPLVQMDVCIRFPGVVGHLQAFWPTLTAPLGASVRYPGEFTLLAIFCFADFALDHRALAPRNLVIVRDQQCLSPQFSVVPLFATSKPCADLRDELLIGLLILNIAGYATPEHLTPTAVKPNDSVETCTQVL